MNNKLLEKINEFCAYLTDWEDKKDYYVEELLPNWVDACMSGLTVEARGLFLEIREITNASEWQDIINLIINVKENYEKIKEEEKQKNINARKEAYCALFGRLKEKYSFEGFIHSSSFENFINIMKSNAIYSRAYIENSNIKHNEIALDEVIDKTSEQVKNYVRFYWRPKTPTNYRNEGIKPKTALVGDNKAHSPNPVIFVFDAEIALDEKIRFSNKNAASYNSRIVPYIDKRFDFNAIFHNGPISEQDQIKKEIIESRCAEFLYPDFISTDKVRKIIFRSKSDYDRAVLIFGEDKRFCIDKEKFCNNWLQIDSYNLITANNTISFAVSFNFGYEFKNNGYTLSDFQHKIILLNKDNIKISEYDIDVKSYYYNIRYSLKEQSNYATLCYYIDNIECIRVSLND